MNKFLITLGLVFSIITISITSQADHGPYDPSRDAFKDFEAAQQQAEQEGKLVLIQIGGNWCSWCHKLERFFNSNTAIKSLRDDTFVAIKVNVSPENDNEAFLREMPEFEGYPFLVITDEDGQILNSRTSGALEDGMGYSESKFKDYFEYWKNAKQED